MSGRLLGGIFLVTGTTIGAGMLALPLLTGAAGFYPALALFAICWLLSLYTAFLTVEINLWFEGDVNLISMARRTLGRYGEAATWIIYLLFLYALCSAYISAGGSLLADLMSVIGLKPNESLQSILFLILFGAIVSFGTRIVDIWNRFLMVGLIASYILLMVLIAPQIDPSLLVHSKPSYLLASVALVTASFGFHMVLPSLTAYLKRDVRQIKLAIIVGSFIPLVVYILWEMAILGIIPVNGLQQALEQNLPITHPLAQFVSNKSLLLFARLFSFFAIVTSFLGVSLSLNAFLTDGLRRGQKKFLPIVLTFTPPLIVALVCQRGFVLALSYAGVFVALLEGALPALMAFKGRALFQTPASYRVIGKKMGLWITLVLSLLVMLLQIAVNAHLIA